MRGGGPPSPAALRKDVERRLFDRGPGPRSPGGAGLEIELLPHSLETGRPLPIDSVEGPSTAALLRSHARGRRWSETLAAAGGPRFRLPGGGALGFEPGGQLEYASPPHRSLGDLLADVEGVLLPLARHAETEGVGLRARGIDPVNPLETAPLRLRSERYLRMARHLDARGPAGARMMRQTAALHLHLDLEERPFRRWRAAQAAAPLLLALFANSARYAGREGAERSVRARQWRELDPLRTGLVLPGDPATGPVDAYLRFALDAPAFLLGPEHDEVRPFREWIGRPEADAEAWTVHLSTLFPEVRPRGWIEVRSVDALPARWWGVPITVLSGLLYDERALQEGLGALPPPDGARLERAGREGMSDPEVADQARALFRIGLDGAARLGDFVGSGPLRRAEEYRERYVEPGTDPAADPDDGVLAGWDPEGRAGR